MPTPKYTKKLHENEKKAQKQYFLSEIVLQKCEKNWYFWFCDENAPFICRSNDRCLPRFLKMHKLGSETISTSEFSFFQLINISRSNANHEVVHFRWWRSQIWELAKYTQKGQKKRKSFNIITYICTKQHCSVKKHVMDAKHCRK